MLHCIARRRTDLQIWHQNETRGSIELFTALCCLIFLSPLSLSLYPATCASVHGEGPRHINDVTRAKASTLQVCDDPTTRPTAQITTLHPSARVEQLSRLQRMDMGCENPLDMANDREIAGQKPQRLIPVPARWGPRPRLAEWLGPYTGTEEMGHSRPSFHMVEKRVCSN